MQTAETLRILANIGLVGVYAVIARSIHRAATDLNMESVSSNLSPKARGRRKSLKERRAERLVKENLASRPTYGSSLGVSHLNSFNYYRRHRDIDKGLSTVELAASSDLKFKTRIKPKPKSNSKSKCRSKSRSKPGYKSPESNPAIKPNEFRDLPKRLELDTSHGRRKPKLERRLFLKKQTKRQLLTEHLYQDIQDKSWAQEQTEYHMEQESDWALFDFFTDEGIGYITDIAEPITQWTLESALIEHRRNAVTDMMDRALKKPNSRQALYCHVGGLKSKDMLACPPLPSAGSRGWVMGMVLRCLRVLRNAQSFILSGMTHCIRMGLRWVVAN
ncbi:MAG: hypothetical protein M1812_005875 [Candelaria pacifica]|nr:MAG: hypothetical protein M1812_005875 [Candelaria pacifica]